MNAIHRHNAHLLFNYPNANFDIRHNGELCIISWYNLLGRFIKWIRNWHGEVTLKIHRAVKDTLEAIYNHNDAANPKDYSTMFYVREDRKGWFFNNVDPYSHYYPAHFLHTSIQSSHQFAADDDNLYQSKLISEISKIGKRVSGQNNQYPYPQWYQHANRFGRNVEYILPWDWNA